MEAKRLGSRYFIRIDIGEEIVGTIKGFCKANGIRLGTVSGIGATNRATVGLLDTKTRQYKSDDLAGDHEITSLLGNITTLKGETYLHLHVTLADREHRSFGGHLNSAVVSATFEGVIEVIDGSVERELDEGIGLNLIMFSK